MAPMRWQAWPRSRRARRAAAAMEDGGTDQLGFKRIRSAALRLPSASFMSWQHESRAFPEDSGGPRYAVRRELETRDANNLLASAHGRWRMLKVQVGALSRDEDVAS